MRATTIIWLAALQGAKCSAFSGSSATPRSDSILWSPKPMLFGLKYMLNLGMCSREDIATVALACMYENTKLPLISMVTATDVRIHMRKYRINPSNLNPARRRARYLWWLTDWQIDLTRYAIENKPLMLKDHIMSVFDTEYLATLKQHKQGRILDARYSPENIRKTLEQVNRNGSVETTDQGAERSL